MLRGMILLKYAMIYVILIEFPLMKRTCGGGDANSLSRASGRGDKSSDSKVEMDLSSLFDTHANRLDEKTLAM